MTWTDLDRVVPLGGLVVAVGVWLRQYMIQQDLTSAAITRLQQDNAALRDENDRLRALLNRQPPTPGDSNDGP